MDPYNALILFFNGTKIRNRRGQRHYMLRGGHSVTKPMKPVGSLLKLSDYQPLYEGNPI